MTVTKQFLRCFTESFRSRGAAHLTATAGTALYAEGCKARSVCPSIENLRVISVRCGGWSLEIGRRSHG